MDKNEKAIGISWWDVFRVFTILVMIGIVSLSGYYTISCWKELGLDDSKRLNQVIQTLIVWPLILNYIALSCLVLCIVAVIKRGFKNLKSEEGLVKGLAIGIIVGFGFWGFLMGLGVSKGNIVEAFVFGVSVGVPLGFFIGVITGLVLEFRRKPAEPAEQEEENNEHQEKTLSPEEENKKD